MRIFYGDGSQQIVDNNTDYTGRIQVTSDQQGTRLTIQKVQLSDEREFFCQVNGLAAGTAEGKTHLRVFGMEVHQKEKEKEKKLPEWQTHSCLKTLSHMDAFKISLCLRFSSSTGSSDRGCLYWNICHQ